MWDCCVTERRDVRIWIGKHGRLWIGLSTAHRVHMYESDNWISTERFRVWLKGKKEGPPKKRCWCLWWCKRNNGRGSANVCVSFRCECDSLEIPNWYATRPHACSFMVTFLNCGWLRFQMMASCSTSFTRTSSRSIFCSVRMKREGLFNESSKDQPNNAMAIN